MDIGIISMRYAKALLQYATEAGKEDAIYKRMHTLSDNFSALPALRMALSNPVLPVGEKFSLISNASGGEPCEEFIRFIRLVLRQRRENLLQNMSLMYIDLYRKLKNITIGNLITAFPVEKEVEDRMKRIVANRTHGVVEFRTKVDPSIEGGFIFEVGTYRLDASVVNQFGRVKRQFIEKNRRIV